MLRLCFQALTKFPGLFYEDPFHYRPLYRIDKQVGFNIFTPAAVLDLVGSPQPPLAPFNPSNTMP